MESVKARLVVKYRRLSDTAIGWVASVEPTLADFDIHADCEREHLDADTSVEWKTIEGTEHAVGFQIMHASVGGQVSGLPWIVNEVVHELVESERSSQRPDDPAQMLKAAERSITIDFAELRRPPTIVRSSKAPMASAKGVEASLSEFITRLERDLSTHDKNQPGLPALRDLLSSISAGKGLSSERTAEATLEALLRSKWENHSAWKQARLLTTQLRFQDSWPAAMNLALIKTAEFDALDLDEDDEDETVDEDA
ncbi:MAG: hypothetical protein ACKODY_08650 [Actinomycetota bacterium]